MTLAIEATAPERKKEINVVVCRQEWVRGGNNVPIITGNTVKVRRLTVLECERLQGLPDNWTNVEFKGKPASDAKRYKAIGNGMAQPCADFVMQRVVEAIRNSKENNHE